MKIEGYYMEDRLIRYRYDKEPLAVDHTTSSKSSSRVGKYLEWYLPYDSTTIEHGQQDSYKSSYGIHYFKVLVQLLYPVVSIHRDQS